MVLSANGRHITQYSRYFFPLSNRFLKFHKCCSVFFFFFNFFPSDNIHWFCFLLCPHFSKFQLTIESVHRADNGCSENVMFLWISLFPLTKMIHPVAFFICYNWMCLTCSDAGAHSTLFHILFQISFLNF